MGSNNTRKLTGLFIALFIAFLLLSILLALINITIKGSSGKTALDILHLVRMSAIQAALSTVFSLFVGIMVAYALNRLEFWGRKIIIALFASAIVAPGLVIAFGLIEIWGRAGIIANLAQSLGLGWDFSIFGLHGILLAHTILNGAFAAIILLTNLDNINYQKLKIAHSLNISPLKRFLLLDLPAINSALPPLIAIIFLLCFTSFPIVLLLGGGPSNQTLEVAIFSAVRLSFDLKFAVQLALVQLAICLIIIMPAIFANPNKPLALIAKKYVWSERGIYKLLAIIILIFAIIIFALPILAIFSSLFDSTIFALLGRESFWRAAITSLSLGSISAFLTLIIALFVSLAMIAFDNKIIRALIGLPLYSYLIIPALVLSLGFFVLARQLSLSTSAIAPLVLILGNSFLALPFAVAVLLPALKAIDKRYNRLVNSLNLSNYSRLKFVEWPLMGREVGIVLALGFCFSLGDLGIISLFATNEFITLPWAMFQASGAYRTNDAAIIGAIMLLLIFAVFLTLPAIFEKWANAGNR